MREDLASAQWEYQTSDMVQWMYYNSTVPLWTAIKIDALSLILDLSAFGSTITEGGPHIDSQDIDTLHPLLCQGVGQFHVQVWNGLLQRWYPEIDPDYDGLYNEGASDPGSTDYRLNGNEIDIVNLDGILVNFNVPGFAPNSDFDGIVGPALKFTFTLYDSNKIFPDGKTFTHIVHL